MSDSKQTGAVPTPDDVRESRRGFLANLLMTGGLVGSGLLVLRHGLAYVFPGVAPPVERKLLVGRVDELKVGEAKPFEIGGQSLFLVRTVAGYSVFSGICTHLGCKIKWEGHRDRFYCPCHDGVFGPDGSVREGPPPRPLDRYAVEVEGTLVYMRLIEPAKGGLA